MCSSDLNPRITVHSVLDTVASVLDVENLADPQFAVVASRVTLMTHQIAVVAPDIQDRPDAQTRFLGISAVHQSLPIGTPVRTTLLITVGDVPGALLNALNPLSRHGVNVRRLEARPTGEPWSYRFFVEFDHASGEADIDTAVDELRASFPDIRWLGTYPRWNAGRRGSIGWRSDAIRVVPETP